MTPAKPQQMAGQNDADDLIAELTRLMANDAKPVTPDSSKAAAPVAETPPASGGQTIRIPGISTPVPANGQNGSRFDFGRPATPAPVASPEPLASWQDRIGGKPSNSTPAEPSMTTPATLDARTVNAPSEEPWRPAIAAGEAERDASPAFDFDFGFNRTRPDASASGRSAPVAPPAAPPAARFETAARSATSAPATFRPSPASAPASPAPSAPAPAPPAPDHDAIAELIAQELGIATSTSAAPTSAATPAASFGPVPSVAVPQPVPAPVQPQPRTGPRPAPAAAPDSDRFQTAPVFGLGGRPSEPAKPSAPDPMDEIENLIGEAVRVELTPPQQPQPARGFAQPVARATPASVAVPQPELRAVPAVPPLNTQFAPRRTSSLRETEEMHDADEAILAAAAASGAEVGHIDSEFDEERPRRGKQRRRRVEAEPQPRGRERDSRQGSTFRSLVVPAVLGTILVAAGFGLYWAVATGHHDGKAPILTADATPTKEVPPKPAPSDDSHSVVMDQLGGATPAPSKETLVSRDQTAGSDATDVASAPPPPDSANGITDNGLANRKVRTVTVRPDGTIVSADDSVAGGAQLPVDRPNVPAVPGAAPMTAQAAAPGGAPAASDPIAAAIASADASSASGAATAASAPAAPTMMAEAAPTPAPLTTDSTPAPATTATAAADTPIVGQPDPNAPIPLPPPHRPAISADSSESAALAPDTSVPSVAPLVDPTVGSTVSTPRSAVNAVIKSGNAAGTQPVDLLGSAQGTTSKPPAKTVPVVTADTTGAVATTTPGAGHVQLSSQTSQAAAQSSAASLQKRFGSLWGTAQLQVVQANLGAKGIYYRVMLPTASAQDAISICTQIKSAGGDCVANR